MAVFEPKISGVGSDRSTKSPTFLGIFFKGVKIYHFFSELNFGQLYRHLAIFIWSHWSRCTSKAPSTHVRNFSTKMYSWAVVVAQLVEQLLTIPEVRGSNPVIGKNLFISIEHLFTVNCVLERRK